MGYSACISWPDDFDAFQLDICKEPVLFFGFAVFNLYAFLVVLIPFRQRNKWAWVATWLLPIGLALPATLDPDIAFYYGVAAACVVGLLLTMKDFFRGI
jgi:hypothetical protein